MLIIRNCIRKLYNNLKRVNNTVKYRLYAKSALRNFVDLANQENWDYFVGFGTLLGVYRDHDFIKGDDDVDIVVNRKCISKRMIEKMQSKGFTYRYASMSTDSKYVNLSFVYHGVTFDVYSYYTLPDDSFIFLIYPYDGINGDWTKSIEKNKFSICKIHFDYEGVEKVDFKGMKVSAPKHTAELLESIYGKTFMKPQKTKGDHSNNYEYVSISEMTAHRVYLSLSDFDRIVNEEV